MGNPAQTTETFIITPDTSLAAGMAEPLANTFDMPRNKHKQHGHGSLTIGTVEGRTAFSGFKGKLNRDALYIKKAGSDELVIPAIYEQFTEAIKKAVAYATQHSKLYHYRAAKLTVRQWEVNPGERQDSADWHPDRRDMDLAEAPFEDDIFVISDRTGTLTQAKPLRDPFNQLAGVIGPIEGLVDQAQAYDIDWMSNNVWHRSAPALSKGVRTFVRINFESPTGKVLAAIPEAEKRRLGLEL